MKHSSQHTGLFGNTLWVLKLNFENAPALTFARVVSAINNSAVNLIRAFLLGIVIDWIITYVNGAHDQHLLLNVLLLFGAFYLFFIGIMGTVRNYADNLFGIKMKIDVPERLLYEKLQRLGSAALENPEVQNLINRYKQNINGIMGLSNYLFLTVGIAVSLCIALVPLFSVVPLATCGLLLVCIPNIFLNKHIINKEHALDRELTVPARKAFNTMSTLTNPQTLKEITLLNAYGYIKNIFEEYISENFTKRKRIYHEWALYDLLSTILLGAAILFGIYQLLGLGIAGKITVGQITFFISAIIAVGGSVDAFSANLASYVGLSVRINEMRALLNWPELDTKNKKTIEHLSIPPHITLENVSFMYPHSDTPVIQNVTLDIKPGEKIAIVGENGAGKTTLIKLISNIYPVSSGKILVNKEDLNTIEPTSWAQNLGVLYQDFNTYTDLSVLENIALGRIDEKIDQKKVEDAAQKADALDFLKEYPEEFNQILSERYEGGIRPSTGQWQKIAIARFFYRNAPILILDEPTASIDAVAEANIFDRIYKFIENKTVIIVSHRFSTVRNADRIIVFDHGQIVEEGSHEELLKKKGKYAHSFNLQAKGYT